MCAQRRTNRAGHLIWLIHKHVYYTVYRALEDYKYCLWHFLYSVFQSTTYLTLRSTTVQKSQLFGINTNSKGPYNVALQNLKLKKLLNLNMCNKMLSRFA
jgi:hypothetical protein